MSRRKFGRCVGCLEYSQLQRIFKKPSGDESCFSHLHFKGLVDDEWEISIETSAPIAQLAEHLTLNQRVLGSSPSGGIEAICTGLH